MNGRMECGLQSAECGEIALPMAEAGAEPCQRIQYYHRLAIRSAAISAMAAIAAGLELLSVKARSRHGEFLPFVQDRCGFSKSAAYRYMGLAAAMLGGEAAAVALADGPAEAAREAIAREARNLDGRSLRQIYQEAGIVKPSDNCGGAREGAGRRRKLSPEEMAEESARLAADPHIATDECGELVSKLYNWAVKEDGFGKLPDGALALAAGAVRKILERGEAVMAARAKIGAAKI